MKAIVTCDVRRADVRTCATCGRATCHVHVRTCATCHVPRAASYMGVCSTCYVRTCDVRTCDVLRAGGHKLRAECEEQRSVSQARRAAHRARPHGGHLRACTTHVAREHIARQHVARQH